MSRVTPLAIQTDGACTGNGRAGAKAGIGVQFGPDDPRNVSEPVVGKQTNNVAELSAIIRAADIARAEIEAGEPVTIQTDSKYSILCATTQGAKLAAAEIRHSVEKVYGRIPNGELVRRVYCIFSGRPNLSLVHVAAHTGGTDVHSLGNAEADRLAVAGAGLATAGSCRSSSFTTESARRPRAPAAPRIQLRVPQEEKDAAKALGARWDPRRKKWWIAEDAPAREEVVATWGRPSTV